MTSEKRSEAIAAAAVEVEWVSLLSLNLHAWKLIEVMESQARTNQVL